jgi:hypothetical protein
MIRAALSFYCCLFSVQLVLAQNFLEPIESFSRNKPCYITLQNGEEIVAEYRSSKSKKGLILKLWVDDGNDKKKELEATDIQFMYLPVSGWEKFNKAMELDATKLKDDSSLNQALIEEGYAYFETVEVMVKKKKQTALMQLLNPAYAEKIRVYHDPWANEQAGLSVSGIQVAGGGDKSFYVKIGDKTAFKLAKKNYDESFAELFGSCKSFVKDIKDPKWNDFEKHVYDFSKDCVE